MSFGFLLQLQELQIIPARSITKQIDCTQNHQLARFMLFNTKQLKLRRQKALKEFCLSPFLC
jgi:hypothetical protein